MSKNEADGIGATEACVAAEVERFLKNGIFERSFDDCGGDGGVEEGVLGEL